MSLNGTEGGGRGDGGSGGGVDNKLLVYLALSVATVAECVLAAYLTLTSAELRQRRATLFSCCLVLSIGVLASLSLVYVLCLLCVGGFTYRSPEGCRVRVVQRYLSVVSCYTLASMALDRYLAICWPLRYHDLLTKPRGLLLCAACWVAPALLLVLPCIGVLSTMCDHSQTEKRLLVAYTVAYTLGAMATLLLYLLVALEFRNKTYSVSSREGQGQGGAQAAYSQEVAVVRHRTANSAFTVLMLYTVLSLPHTLLPVVTRIEEYHVPKIVLEIGYLVHRFHLLLFLPMYARTNALFLASLSAWGKVFWRRLTCYAAGRMNPPMERETTHTEDNYL